MRKFIILSLVWVLLTSLPAAFCAAAEDGYTFTIIGDQATITGYSGKPEVIEIPPAISGVPVTGIRDNSFYNCETLRSITLPESIKTIGHHCFYGCASLETIALPEGLEELGMGCFFGCSSLSAVTLPDTLSVLPDSCFRRCESLCEIILPQSVKRIEKFCFCGCSSLKYISLSGSLSDIGIGSFYMCGELRNIYIPDSVKNIGDDALGFSRENEKTGLTILGSKGSAAERYALENDIPFSDTPDTLPVFRPESSENAPVSLPPAMAAVGGLLFLLTALAALRQYLPGKKHR